MKKAIQYFIQYSTSANVILLGLAIVGIISLFNASRSQFPRTTSRDIIIDATFVGGSPKELEEGVTLKIEDELRGLDGIKKVTSLSVENRASINIALKSGFDADKALTDVKNAVDRIIFPDDVETPIIYKKERLDLAAEFALTGDVDLKTLKVYAEGIEKELLAIDGISKVVLNGYPEEEIEIAVREDALHKYGITIQQVAQAVANSNLELTGGQLEVEHTNITIRAKNQKYYANNLEGIIVKTSTTGANIFLKDVASVVDKWVDSPQRNFYGGKPAVNIIIQSRLTEDIVSSAEKVKQFIKEFNTRETQIQAHLMIDGSLRVRQRTDLLVENGLIGIGLVLLVLGLFLKPRIAFWVALSIPISLLGMFIVAPMFGVNINMLSLFGMILVLGILVDDGVVIAENIFQKYEQGMPPVQAAFKGTLEVVPSIVSAVLTTCWFFCLFFLVEGTMGDLISNIGFVVVATLLISLIEGFFILPAHIAHSRDLKKVQKPNAIERGTTAVFEGLKNKIYKPLLQFSLNNKMITFAVCTVMLMLSFAIVRGGHVLTTFFPFIDRDDVLISLRLPSGTTEQITNDKLERIERAVWDANDKLSAARTDGQQVVKSISRTLGPTTNEGYLKVILLNGEQRGMESFVVENAIQDTLEPIYEAERLSMGNSSMFGSAIQIGFVGTDVDKLRMAKNDLRKVLESMDELKSISDNDRLGGKEIDLKLTEKAKGLGVDLGTILLQVRQAYFGYEVQRLQRGTDEIKVWVRYAESERQSFGTLEEMEIRVGQNAYPLKELAEFEMIDGVLGIEHLDGLSKLEVSAEQRDPNASVTDILTNLRENVVPDILEKYTGIDVVYGGQNESAAESIGSIYRWLPITLLLVFFTVVLTFRSFKQASVVFLLIPFAFIGVVAGHWLHGKPISILSIFGILAVAGVVINDSLVLVSTMNRLLKEGQPFKEALFQASVSRFRPILLTSVTTIAGLMPLVLETSLQAQLLIPMAISLAYGLAAATFIMLLLLPVLLVFVNNLSRWLWWIWEGEWIEEEAVEPAIKEMEHEFTVDR
ncbi:MAG: efflux RND transporter permease subunit [Saprospiraceae bacterium]|nr:efflux RND transporter permease subunit [Saprospiraceae bacterium]